QKASREEVGRFVAELFERERTWLRGRIRESVAAAEAEQTPVLLPTLQPEAHTPSPPPPRKSRRWLAALAIVPLLALAVFWRLRTPSAAAAELRLCGSNTIGTELAPALVEAFVKHSKTSFSIDTTGTVTAFPMMAAGRCDVGMLSRPMSDEDRKTFAVDLRAPATEHVIGLDGIAVVVHPNNRIRSLEIEQIRAIFTGEIRDWEAVGGASGPIDVYARDTGSSTWDTFRHLVLDSRKLSPAVHQIADSNQLSDKVATEPNAIGFVGLVFIRSANAVAVGATVPSPFTVADESYPLTRRLYFYTLPKPASTVVTDFVTFVLSPEGQEVVRQKGFVDLSIAARAPDPTGARKLTVDFRFRPGTADLDSRATRDVDRLVSFLRANPISRVSLRSYGGDARRVVAELERRGVKPENVKTLPGRSRHVEVWVR
ncbi:MAG: phosphate ABC transporter substrate-binding protein, partial [Myxococcales bacterium]|nr:phosphate ABC transporter substrate-binding protein [Myxococcales bacterium]